MKINNPGRQRRIAAGTYVGDGGDNRQIAVGFRCAFVIVMQGAQRAAFFAPGYVLGNDPGAEKVGGSELHAVDGFTVFETADSLNLGTQVLTYFAIEADP